jgi:hypothetical protein
MVPGARPQRNQHLLPVSLEEMEIDANITFMKNNKKTNFTLNRL